MFELETETARTIFRNYRHALLRVADPGALAILRELALHLHEMGLSVHWFVAGWAETQKIANAQKETELPAALKDFSDACLLIGAQTNFSRTRELIRLGGETVTDTIYLFDSWKHWLAPFVEPESKQVRLPNWIFVPDEIARNLFLQEWEMSFPEILESLIERTKVIGQPAIHATVQKIRSISTETVVRFRQQVNPQQRPLIALLLDPTESQETISENAPEIGYDVHIVLRRLAEELPMTNPNARVLIKSHPRLPLSRIETDLQLWKENGIDFLVVDDPPEVLVSAADEVWGMTSMALVAAKLAGKRVCSLQYHRNETGRKESNPHLEPFVVEK